MATWNELTKLIEQIARKHGNSIYDSRVGKTWDAGQAVCAEVYGPHWQFSVKFKDANENDAECPMEAIIAATKMLKKLPEWANSPKKLDSSDAERLEGGSRE